jgi:hypothetical protein
MAANSKTHEMVRTGVERRTPEPAFRHQEEPGHDAPSIGLLERVAAKAPAALRPADVLTLQRSVGNRAVRRLLSHQDYSLSNLPSTSRNTIQRSIEEEEAPLRERAPATSRPANRTGLPDRLKTGVESLSGLSMDDVRVHYNSSKPAELQARAYTQGSDIHLGPDEEEHLPHEAWHVVQQKQGRVKPTIQAKGLPVNDEHGLENEADVMGQRAVQANPEVSSSDPPGVNSQNEFATPTQFMSGRTIQRVVDTFTEKVRLWGWLEQRLDAKGALKNWRDTTMNEFWALVDQKLAPTVTKATDAQTGINNIQPYMIRADPDGCRAELNALRESTPEIDDSPAIRDADAVTMLSDLKARVTWIARPQNLQWVRPLAAELARKKANLTFAEQWQIYGEAIIAEQRNETKNSRWNVNATNVANGIKAAGVSDALDTWLDDVRTRTTNLTNLWNAGSATVAGTYGTIPQATVQELFMTYPNVTRQILTDAVGQTVAGHNWGGVKLLNHGTYASELKINAMGGDDRVFARNATPTMLDVIAGGLH